MIVITDTLSVTSATYAGLSCKDEISSPSSKPPQLARTDITYFKARKVCSSSPPPWRRGDSEEEEAPPWCGPWFPRRGGSRKKSEGTDCDNMSFRVVRDSVVVVIVIIACSLVEVVVRGEVVRMCQVLCFEVCCCYGSVERGLWEGIRGVNEDVAVEYGV